MKTKLDNKPEITLAQVIKEAKTAFPGYGIRTSCFYYAQIQIKIIKYSRRDSAVDESSKKLVLLQLFNDIGTN